MEDNYKIVNSLSEDIEKLDEKIANIGNDNIINHSTVKEVEGMMKDINKKIKRTNRINGLITCIRNIKIFGRFLQGGLPYIVVASLVFTGQTLLGDVPFYPQKSEFKVAQHEQIIDANEGVIDEKIEYITEGHGAKNEVTYTTKWEKKNDGNYYRVTQTYDIGNYSTEELKEMINNPSFSFDETFGKSKSNKYEYKSEKDITQEDLEAESGFKIIYHYTDDLDVILGAQDTTGNILLSVLYILITVLGSLPVIYWRIEESDYYFTDHLERIKEENPNIDIDEIKRLFKEKKIKFDVVKREQVMMEDPITGQQQIIKK